MPNWCLNHLTISHPDTDRVDRFESAYMRGDVCETFLPEPKDDEGNPIVGADYDENGKFKMPDWYEWRIANWGTKWDFGYDTDRGLQPTRVDNEVTVRFDTAWSPPLGLYECLNALGYSVQAYYFEPGMCFAGEWIDGVDTYWENDVSQFSDEVLEMFDVDSYYEDDGGVII